LTKPSLSAHRFWHDQLSLYGFYVGTKYFVENILVSKALFSSRSCLLEIFLVMALAIRQSTPIAGFAV
jgi:hypothetical protein